MSRRTLLELIGAGAGATTILWPAAWSCGAAAQVAPGAPAAKTLSDKVADFIVGARFEDLPPAVVRKAKEQIIFLVGGAFEGALAQGLLGEDARAMREIAKQIPLASGGATVIGERFRLPIADAAFANATLIGGLDDVIWPAAIHTGIITLPTAFAVGETRRASGREMLLALVLGYEVLGKLGRAQYGWTAQLPRRPVMIFAGYGPITVAGRLMKFDRERMQDALGYAANLGMGIAEGPTINHYYGMAIRNGTFAAQLVETGAKASSRTTIEGETGLYRSFFGEVPATVPKLIDSLGSNWEIMTAEQKRYPGTSQNTTATELFTQLVREHKLTAEQVAGVDAFIPNNDVAARRESLAARGPFESAQKATGSLPYAMALVLVDGEVTSRRFADDQIIKDPVVAQVMRKMNVQFERDRGLRWARIVIRTQEGHRIEREVENLSFEFPQSMWGEWLHKRGERLLPAAQLTRLEQLIANIEDVDDVNVITANLVPPPAA